MLCRRRFGQDWARRRRAGALPRRAVSRLWTLRGRWPVRSLGETRASGGPGSLIHNGASPTPRGIPPKLIKRGVGGPTHLSGGRSRAGWGARGAGSRRERAGDERPRRRAGCAGRPRSPRVLPQQCRGHGPRGALRPGVRSATHPSCSRAPSAVCGGDVREHLWPSPRARVDVGTGGRGDGARAGARGCRGAGRGRERPEGSG